MQQDPGEGLIDQVNSLDNGNLLRLGVGYHLFSEQLQDQLFFNDLLMQLNIYHTDTTLRVTSYMPETQILQILITSSMRH